MSICRGVHQRDRTAGTFVVRDLKDDGWASELSGTYDVVATVNALHWFDAARAEQLIGDIHGMLHDGGVFLLAEPVSCERPFAAGFKEWKERQPPRYAQENWHRFWSRANALLGYDHIKLLGSRDDVRIGDDLSVAGWIGLIARGGFGSADVLLRDADQVILASQR
jgi:hypothetical protein